MNDGVMMTWRWRYFSELPFIPFFFFSKQTGKPQKSIKKKNKKREPQQQPQQSPESEEDLLAVAAGDSLSLIEPCTETIPDTTTTTTTNNNNSNKTSEGTSPQRHSPRRTVSAHEAAAVSVKGSPIRQQKAACNPLPHHQHQQHHHHVLLLSSSSSSPSPSALALQSPHSALLTQGNVSHDFVDLISEAHYYPSGGINSTSSSSSSSSSSSFSHSELALVPSPHIDHLSSTSSRNLTDEKNSSSSSSQALLNFVNNLLLQGIGNNEETESTCEPDPADTNVISSDKASSGHAAQETSKELQSTADWENSSSSNTYRGEQRVVSRNSTGRQLSLFDPRKRKHASSADSTPRRLWARDETHLMLANMLGSYANFYMMESFGILPINPSSLQMNQISYFFSTDEGSDIRNSLSLSSAFAMALGNLSLHWPNSILSLVVVLVIS